jgi:hypothetical protein
MKTLILTGSLLTSLVSYSAPRSWTFTYKPKNKSTFQIKKEAQNQDDAFKMAAKECFSTLTNGVYPGESAGLEYIDVCANPKM